MVGDSSERQRMGDGSVSTEVAGLTIEQADGKLTKRLRQVLFRVDVLQRAFSSCQAKVTRRSQANGGSL